MEEFDVIRHGLRLHTRVWAPVGDAEAHAIVFVHGLGVSTRYAAPTADLLARRFAVYGMDSPGFGRSSKPGQVLSVPELADVMVDWLHAIGLRRVVLWGNSFGCQIVADVAFRYPACVSRLVLEAPTIDPHAHSMLAQMWRSLFIVPTVPLSLIRIALGDYFRCGPWHLLLTLRRALDDHIEAKFPFIYVPTLVIRGTRDPIVSQQWAEEAARFLPDGRLMLIPGGTHGSLYTHPHAVADGIEDFVVRHVFNGPENAAALSARSPSAPNRRACRLPQLHRRG